ncbi:MAG: NAD-dependent epimerase/dehydratase family protein [Deltaproteobacteria bacterium]|nr:NAD-dependent epimerase/dehydratase family protein [Deltaproteobacteria bacterium]
MEKGCILITGANGEIGHGLIRYLAHEGLYKIVALDRSPIDDYQKSVDFYKGDILDKNLIDELNRKYNFTAIFHLAAILSTGGEKEPLPAHRVNVEGSLNILNLADDQSNRTKTPVVVVFPSTIAAYGFATPEQRIAAGKIDEHRYLDPITMYGINKLYIEHLGNYYSTRYRSFEDTPNLTRLDFRCVRLPGIMSSESLPSGGTSDFGPEMIHAAAQGKPYECFVTAETRLPFIVMPDGVHSLISISRASRRSLTKPVYNVGSFSISAGEIRNEVLKYFPKAEITFKPNPKRLAIVDSWPVDVDDSAARKDWGWRPEFDREGAFKNYLIPGITRRYASQRPQQSSPPLQSTDRA